MKKIIFSSIVALFAVVAFAQQTTPRFLVGTYGRTNAAQLNAYVAATDATGADTVELKPQAMRTVVKIAAVDSVAFKFASVANSYYGDEVIIVATNSSGSGHKLKLVSTNAEPSSTGSSITLASTLGAVWRFIFNGVKWVEASRAVQ